jgi:hypothetical protein
MRLGAGPHLHASAARASGYRVKRAEVLAAWAAVPA